MPGVEHRLYQAGKDAISIHVEPGDQAEKLAELICATMVAYSELVGNRAHIEGLTRQFQAALAQKDEAWVETNALRRQLRHAGIEPLDPVAIAQNPACSLCKKNPVAVEIEGRVLVCSQCASDPEIREHAKEDWR